MTPQTPATARALTETMYRATKAIYTPASKLPLHLRKLPILHTIKITEHDGALQLTQVIWDSVHESLTPISATCGAKTGDGGKPVNRAPLATCVPARPFLEWLAVSNEARPHTKVKRAKTNFAHPEAGILKLELDPASQILHITAGNAKATFKCIDAAEFPAPLPKSQ